MSETKLWEIEITNSKDEYLVVQSLEDLYEMQHAFKELYESDEVPPNVMPFVRLG